MNFNTCFIKIFLFIYRAKLIDSAESTRQGHGPRCPSSRTALYLSPKLKKFHNRLWDCSLLIAEFSRSQSCLCLYFFTWYKYDNYLRNGLMGYSNNLENIKVKVTFTTRKLPSPNTWQTKLSKFFHYSFFFFSRGEEGAATP